MSDSDSSTTIASKVPGDEGKAGHTELPWRVHPYMSLRVVDQNDITIAGTGTDSTIRDQWEANARFIVRACNAHADLLAALEAADMFITNGVALGFIRMPDPETPDSAHKTPDMIRAAIRKAKGA